MSDYSPAKAIDIPEAKQARLDRKAGAYQAIVQSRHAAAQQLEQIAAEERRAWGFLQGSVAEVIEDLGLNPETHTFRIESGKLVVVPVG